MKTFAYLLLSLTLVLSACSRAQPTPTPDEMLANAGQAVLDMSSAQFQLVREGPPAVFDAATGTTFAEASGKYQAPDRVSAAVKVGLFGSVLEVQMLWLPEGNFISNPLTGAFEKAPADTGFNGAVLFGTDGVAAVLQSGIQGATLAGTEKIEDVDAYRVSGQADGERLAVLTAGALSAGVMYPVDVWIATATSHPIRVHITEPDGNGWLLDLFAVDEPVEIKAP